jgi:hypothetical protein
MREHAREAFSGFLFFIRQELTMDLLFIVIIVGLAAVSFAFILLCSKV